MLPKQLLRDWFYFNKKERLFAIIVVVAISASLFLPPLLAPLPAPLAIEKDSLLLVAADTLQHRKAKRASFQTDEPMFAHSFEPSSRQAYTAGELFEFDPNTANLEEWQRLGLSERTARTVLNYVRKGGKFYKPEDLQKIWGMPKGFYERVKAYVTITSVRRNTYPAYEERAPAGNAGRRVAIIDINKADTADFIALPGIGSKLSARIVLFREKLGGFYAVEQIGETYGLPDSTFQKLKGRLAVEGTELRQLNVNTATKEELKAHPYIRWNLANAIVEYRNQHGPFQHLEELMNIVLIDEAAYAKLSPYLRL